MSWFLVFVGFCALIVLHEAGHFAAAKAVGMRVERFFLFFPPKLFSVRRGETEYGIGAIPLGGFVKITGMNPEELEAAERGDEKREPTMIESIEGADSGPNTPGKIEGSGAVDPEILKRAYYNQPVWKRIVVIGAGPLVNIVIAFLILFALSFNVGEPTALEVADVKAGAPADGQLETGDRIVSVDGTPAEVPGITQIENPDQRLDKLSALSKTLSDRVNSHTCAGEPTHGCTATTPATVLVKRDGELVTLRIPPTYDTETTPGDPRYRLGFSFGTTGNVTVHRSAPEAAGLALDQMWLVTTRTVEVFARLFETEQRKQVSGVVGISDAAHTAVESDSRQAWLILALVSLSLGIINLFPFLPLDGGHIFWSLVEKLRGRRVPMATIERATGVGFLVFIMLFVIGLTNDIGRLN